MPRTTKTLLIQPANKIIPLESMRGIAAFMVFLFHFILGFVPQRHGQEIATAISGGTLIETPLFFLINGHAAVVFFFVLSGFVLSYRFFEKRVNEGLLRSVIKRWPRLFLVALMSTIFSWLMIHYGLYSYAQTAEITHSEWMTKFAFARGSFWELSAFEAFTQGFFFTFFRGDQNLNTSLWTMHYEFIGSLLVFGLIPILNGIKVRSALILFVILSLVAFYTNAYMCAFIAGCFLSYYRCQLNHIDGFIPRNKIKLVIGLVFVILAFGYVEPGRGFYFFMNDLFFDESKPIRIIIHTIAAVVLIEVILNYKLIYRLFNSRITRFLGRCSFSLYVIHVPLMFSFSTFVFLSTLNTFGYQLAVILTFTLSVPVLLIVSWLMTLVDECWCRNVNQTVKRLV